MSMTVQQMEAELARLKAENEALRTKRLGLKVTVADPAKGSKGGALALTGLRRFPVTFYRDEWEAILAEVPNIRKFIDAHKAELPSLADRRTK